MDLQNSLFFVVRGVPVSGQLCCELPSGAGFWQSFFPGFVLPQPFVIEDILLHHPAQPRYRPKKSRMMAGYRRDLGRAAYFRGCLG